MGFPAFWTWDLIAYIIMGFCLLFCYVFFTIHVHLFEICINCNIFYCSLSSLVKDSQGLRHIRGEKYPAFALLPFNMFNMEFFSL